MAEWNDQSEFPQCDQDVKNRYGHEGVFTNQWSLVMFFPENLSCLCSICFLTAFYFARPVCVSSFSPFRFLAFLWLNLIQILWDDKLITSGNYDTFTRNGFTMWKLFVSAIPQAYCSKTTFRRMDDKCCSEFKIQIWNPTEKKLCFLD